MKLQPYKFLVQAVVQQVDDSDNVVGELAVGGQQGEPVTVFGIDALVEWAKNFPDKLLKAESE